VGPYDENLNMDSNLPFTSVIVPALNEEQTIRECLVSLLKVDYPPERLGISAKRPVP